MLTRYDNPAFLLASLMVILLTPVALAQSDPPPPLSEVKLTASDAASLDYFGQSVGFSWDMSTIVVGSPEDDDGGNDSGSAYVFVPDGVTWREQAKLTAGDAVANDYFGARVAISETGDTVVIGAPAHDAAGSDSGAAYVFVRSGETWSQQQKLTASDAAAGDAFGFDVAIDGDTVVVGAAWDEDRGPQSGAAYVFVRSGTTWSQQQKLTADDAAADDEFGRSVSISLDTVVVGAPYDDDDGAQSGAAYVFLRSGTAWSQQQKLTAADAAAGDTFGTAVSIYGEKIVAGAPLDDDGGAESGAAYVFVRSGTAWSQLQKLVAADAVEGAEFGSSLAIGEDFVLLGAPKDPNDTIPEAGSVYGFDHERTTDTYHQQLKITASDAAPGGPFGTGAEFGTSVGLAERGGVVGAPLYNGVGENSGAAYTYEGVQVSKDFNADSMSDILWRNMDNGATRVWEMAGFTIDSLSVLNVVSTDWVLEGAADFDRDSQVDILWRHATSGATRVWKLDGSKIVENRQIGVVSNLWAMEGLGDFDGDRKADILWRYTPSGATRVWRMDGFEVMQNKRVAVVPADWVVEDLDDLDGDGKAEVVWRRATTGATRAWKLDGTTVLENEPIGVVPVIWAVEGLEDFDGDGRADILWRHGDTGAVRIWLMDGFSRLSHGPVGTVPLDWLVEDLGAYDGDKGDILWRNKTNGTVRMWQMDGLDRLDHRQIGVVPMTWKVH